MARRHGRQNVVYVDGLDVSGDSSGIEIAMQFDTAEVSGAVEKKYYIMGQGGANVTQSAWFNRTAASGIHAIMAARVGATGHFAVAFGTQVGDGGFAGSASLVKEYQVTTPLAGAVATQGLFEHSDKFDYVETLHPKSTLAAAQTGKNDNAASNNGLRAYMHQFQVLGGTPAISVEHSTALASGYVALGTFTPSDAVGAKAFEVAGAVNQYVRVTVANGSAVAWIGYTRL